MQYTALQSAQKQQQQQQHLTGIQCVKSVDVYMTAAVIKTQLALDIKAKSKSDPCIQSLANKGGDK